jgi:hypothetical protein
VTFWASTVMVALLNILFTFRNAHRVYNARHISPDAGLRLSVVNGGRFGCASRRQESQMIFSFEEISVNTRLYKFNSNAVALICGFRSLENRKPSGNNDLQNKSFFSSNTLIWTDGLPHFVN